MARPPKSKLDYAGWSVDIFDNDTRIDKLIDAHGWAGFGIYFYLCQRAYGSDGYFYKWGYDDCASTARKMGGGIGSGTVKEAVGYCLQIGLFDKGLFDRWGIITSEGIQSRYWEVAKNRDVKKVISEFWLLQNCDGLITEPLNTDLSGGNPSFRSGNPSFQSGNSSFPPLKESKVKESKGKEIETPPISPLKGERGMKPKKSRAKRKPPVYYPNDEKLDQAFADYVDMRKKIKKPMTERAIALAMNKLEKLSRLPLSDSMDNDTAIGILEQSIMNSWLGLFPLKNGQGSRGSGGDKDILGEWRNS